MQQDVRADDPPPHVHFAYGACPCGKPWIEPTDEARKWPPSSTEAYEIMNRHITEQE